MSRKLDYMASHHDEKELSEIIAAIGTAETKYDTSKCNGDIGESICRTLDNIDRPISELCAMIKNYMTKKHEEERKAQVRHAIEVEWKYLGIVLDRVFMIVYLTVVVVSVAVMFPK